MNDLPLPVSHFLYFDPLPLGFNEQELSRKIRRISVHLYPEERGGEGTYVCVWALRCANICARTRVFIYVHTRVYPHVHVGAPVSMC